MVKIMYLSITIKTTVTELVLLDCKPIFVWPFLYLFPNSNVPEDCVFSVIAYPATTYSSYSHNITSVVKAKLISDKNSLFDRESIGVMGLYAKKNTSQYMGILGYPVAQGIKRRTCPYLQASQVSISAIYKIDSCHPSPKSTNFDRNN